MIVQKKKNWIKTHLSLALVETEAEYIGFDVLKIKKLKKRR